MGGRERERALLSKRREEQAQAAAEDRARLEAELERASKHAKDGGAAFA